MELHLHFSMQLRGLQRDTVVLCYIRRRERGKTELEITVIICALGSVLCFINYKIFINYRQDNKFYYYPALQDA